MSARSNDKWVVEIDLLANVPTPETLAEGHMGFQYDQWGANIWVYVNDRGVIRELMLGNTKARRE